MSAVSLLRSRAELQVLAALLTALALGMVLGDAPAWRGLYQTLQVVGTLWVNAIRMTVIPLVVSLLITGVSSVATTGGMGRLGARTLSIFGLLLLGSAAVSLGVSGAIFRWYPYAASGAAALPSGALEAAREVSASGATGGFGDWLVSLVPINPIAAAAQGNLLSLLVFAMVLAVAVARSPQHAREPVASFFTGLGAALLLVVRWVIALAPVGVFALVVPLAARNGSLLAGAVGFYIAAFAATCAVTTAMCYPLVAVGTGIGLRSFARSVLPAQLIGISCSSSIATLPAMVRSADALGVPSRVSGFVLPVAVSVFKPAAPVAWLVGGHFVARFFGVPLGVRELLVVTAASVFLSFAAPGVPRGAFLLLTPLFTNIGLPAEGIGLLIAVDAIPDACATVVNVTGDLAATALVAGDRHAGGVSPDSAPLAVG